MSSIIKQDGAHIYLIGIYTGLSSYSLDVPSLVVRVRWICMVAAYDLDTGPRVGLAWYLCATEMV